MPADKDARTIAVRAAFPRSIHDAAGIDIGSTFHVVAVPSDRDEQPVRTFRSFSGDLHQLADWLTAVGITTVAMESTGVYWIPVFEILEARGFEVLLVNARDVKHVPGRKTDVNDAQWLQQLHQHGLLRGSFRPRDGVVRLRAYLRHRERLVDYAAAHIQHMQKALMQMNVQLHHVVTDITGLTGMRIIRAIVAGNHAPEQLAEYPRPPVQRVGGDHPRGAHRQLPSRARLRASAGPGAVRLPPGEGRRVRRGDRSGLARAERRARRRPTPRSRPCVTRRAGTSRRSTCAPAFYTLLGADLSQIHGFGPYTVLRLVAECGDDMTKWPTAKHFTSWLSLAPGNKISGGRLLSSKTRRSSNRATALLRIAAVNIGKTADGARRLLPPTRGPHRQSQGGDRDRSQAGGSVLQRAPIRHDLRGPRRVLL